MKFERSRIVNAVNFQVRRARSVNPVLAAAIRSVCETMSGVMACHILDAKRTDRSDVWMAVVLQTSSDDRFSFVAERIGVILDEFPDEGARAIIIPMTCDISERFAGFELYKR